jgi:hypothetical protein
LTRSCCPSMCIQCENKLKSLDFSKKRCAKKIPEFP